MIFHRDIEETLKRLAKFPVVALLGPRQAGKTTLVQQLFKKHHFISFEDPIIREFALTDPRKFLQQYENPYGIILDEFQYVPQILSYIQLEADAKNRPGYFVITGSQNFLMNQAITQSLAGRVAIVTLLPLSLHELASNNLLPNRADQTLFQGGYPRIYAQSINPTDLYPAYIQTYIERDVRQLINVGDLRTFQKFLSLCAGRVGQLLNLSDIATNCSISVPTASDWLSLLEASYVLFLLPPYFNNFNKRLTRTAKLYFYDTGLACNLLGITSPDILAFSPFRGALFENFIISDLSKQFFNRGQRPPLYFWRDQNGRIEVDCVINAGTKLIPIEIKASQTISMDFFKQLSAWNELSKTETADTYVIYAGEHKQSRSKGTILGWQQAATFVDLILPPR